MDAGTPYANSYEHGYGVSFHAGVPLGVLLAMQSAVFKELRGLKAGIDSRISCGAECKKQGHCVKF